MNIVLDIGNTLSKAAIYENDELMEILITPEPDVREIRSLIGKYKVKRGILSSVKNISSEILSLLNELPYFLELSHNIDLPVKILYKTPETLGKDRIAGAVGAWSLFPNKNILVIDAGTCITYDMVSSSGDHIGGNITPGMNMRLKAMNAFTGRLPAVAPEPYNGLIGDTTANAMLSGVYQGVIGEVRHFINSYGEKYEDLYVVMTGGDHNFFESNLKKEIFAIPNLVLQGLNKILNYNVH